MEFVMVELSNCALIQFCFFLFCSNTNSQYEAALDGVTRLGLALHEVRVVSSILTYRICRLHLFRKEWSEAKAKFQRVVSVFKSAQPIPALAFENAEFFEFL